MSGRAEQLGGRAQSLQVADAIGSGRDLSLVFRSPVTTMGTCFRIRVRRMPDARHHAPGGATAIW